MPRSEDIGPESDGVIWYPGDIYALGGSPHLIPLPSNLSVSSPIIYDIFISVDYEIRLFGDPHAYPAKSDVPVSFVDVSVSLEQSEVTLVVGENHVVPDLVGGWMLGNALGVELKSMRGDWTVDGVNVVAGQTRRLSLMIDQSKPIFTPLSIELAIKASRSDSVRVHTTVSASIDLRHLPALESMTPADLATIQPLKQTYFAPHASRCLLLPPLSVGSGSKNYTTPIVALHGAGVTLDNPFWPAAIPRQNGSWVVIPSGGSSWGYDWRGPSLQDTLAAVSALRAREPRIAPGLVVIGHSNGGQGTFHIASRYPDLVHSCIPAAAYQSAPLYVPETYSHGRYWLDPALDSILKASTAGGDNERFFGNLVRSRVRVVHGGDDGNVPVWHGRAAVQAVKQRDHTADIELIEVPQKDHWFYDVFTHPQRAQILADFASSQENDNFLLPSSFTLSVLWPRESGSMGGYRVLDTKVHGRLFARAHVVNGTIVTTTNVRVLSYRHPRAGTGVLPIAITLDAQHVQLDHDALHGPVIFLNKDGGWEKVHPSVSDELTPRSGPISQILVSEGPLTIVVSDDPRTLGAARRLAWALYTYLGLDIVITPDRRAVNEMSSLHHVGSVVVLSARSPTRYGQAVLHDSPSEFKISRDGSFMVQGKEFKETGTGKSS
ncbi:hypothetical protein FRB96_001216 [Tulasnella sp. 330]|nr:hypothetical protein FRB96_001216 [Tulasnella sp. 330]